MRANPRRIGLAVHTRSKGIRPAGQRRIEEAALCATKELLSDGPMEAAEILRERLASGQKDKSSGGNIKEYGASHLENRGSK